MRNATSSPTLAPSLDVTIYLVLDDFGKIGRAYREADEEASDIETIITSMLSGQYTKPMRVVAFNTAEGWSRDVSELGRCSIDASNRASPCLQQPARLWLLWWVRTSL
jgi:hypothetical protein